MRKIALSLIAAFAGCVLWASDGISLGGDETRLAAALKSVKAEVIWISSLPMSESQQKNIAPLLAIRQHVRRVYAKYGENVSKAAAALKITRNTLRKYL